MAFLYDLFVKLDERGQKIGQNLLMTCIKYIRENDYSHLGNGA
ncbi:GNAT family N-acetyltransferase [Neobacillus fumarioli]